MKPRDKKITGVAVLLAVAAGLFPPWSLYRSGNPSGYHFLFLPPTTPIHIDTSRLFIEWILIGGIAVATRYMWGR
jgi:hypothetical protein